MDTKRRPGAAKIATVVCWAITALILAGLVLWVFTGSLFGIQTGSMISFGGSWESLSGPYEEQGNLSVSLAGIDSIYVDWQAGEVVGTPYDGDEINIVEYAQRELTDEEHLYYTIEGSTLKIRYRENQHYTWWNRMPKKNIKLYIPQNLAENLTLLQLGSVSGDIRISNITAETVKAVSTSGDLYLTDISADTVRTDTTSGNSRLNGIKSDSIWADSTSGSVSLDSVKSQKIDANTVSGRITFRGTEADSVNLDSTSGRLDIEGTFRDVTINSTSGGIDVKSSVLPDSLKIDTTSGGVTIAVPETQELAVTYDSVSGKLSSDFPVSMGGKNPRFRINTVSGGAHIKVYEQIGS